MLPGSMLPIICAVQWVYNSRCRSAAVGCVHSVMAMLAVRQPCLLQGQLTVEEACQKRDQLAAQTSSARALARKVGAALATCLCDVFCSGSPKAGFQAELDDINETADGCHIFVLEEPTPLGNGSGGDVTVTQAVVVSMDGAVSLNQSIALKMRCHRALSPYVTPPVSMRTFTQEHCMMHLVLKPSRRSRSCCFAMKGSWLLLQSCHESLPFMGTGPQAPLCTWQTGLDLCSCAPADHHGKNPAPQQRITEGYHH